MLEAREIQRMTVQIGGGASKPSGMTPEAAACWDQLAIEIAEMQSKGIGVDVTSEMPDIDAYRPRSKKFSPSPVAPLEPTVKDWEEELHPRDDHGRFGGGSGGEVDIELPPPDLSEKGLGEAIEHWTWIGSKEVREYIRQGELPKDFFSHDRELKIKQTASTLLAAVENGEKSPALYRGLHVDDKAFAKLSELKKGSDLTLSVTSWSENKGIADDFSKDPWDQPNARAEKHNGVVFEVSSVRGYNVSRKSEKPGEKEWVTDGKFRVVSARKTGELLRVKLQQVATLAPKKKSTLCNLPQITKWFDELFDVVGSTKSYKEFDESLHPRDEHGRFGESGGDEPTAESNLKIEDKTGDGFNKDTELIILNADIKDKANAALEIAKRNGDPIPRTITDRVRTMREGGFSLDKETAACYWNSTTQLIVVDAKVERENAIDVSSGWMVQGNSVLHELGHHFQRTKIGTKDWQNGKNHSRIPDVKERETAHKVSRYAMTSPAEFVAEYYAGVRSGKKYDKDVHALAHKYLTKSK